MTTDDEEFEEQLLDEFLPELQNLLDKYGAELVGMITIGTISVNWDEWGGD